MTEKEWLASNNLGEMVYFLPTQNERKWLLFAVSCCECIRNLLHDSRSRNALDLVERIADAKSSHNELVAAHDAACTALADSRPERKMHPVEDIARVIAIPTLDAKGRAQATAGWVSSVVGESAWKAASGQNRRYQKKMREAAWRDESVKQCNLLRDIIGNPFRPVTLDRAWLTPNVVALAQSIYDDAAFDRLPVLADALEKAGCTNADILSDCREPGPHVRGCWAVDLVLGKE